jgi:hypothetical protein
MAVAGNINILVQADVSQLGVGLNKAKSEMRKFDAEASRVFDATRTPLERYRKEQEKLGTLFKMNKIGADTYRRAIRSATVDYQKSLPPIIRMRKELEGVARAKRAGGDGASLLTGKGFGALGKIGAKGVLGSTSGAFMAGGVAGGAVALLTHGAMEAAGALLKAAVGADSVGEAFKKIYLGDSYIAREKAIERAKEVNSGIVKNRDEADARLSDIWFKDIPILNNPKLAGPQTPLAQEAFGIGKKLEADREKILTERAALQRQLDIQKREEAERKAAAKNTLDNAPAAAKAFGQLYQAVEAKAMAGTKPTSELEKEIAALDRTASLLSDDIAKAKVTATKAGQSEGSLLERIASTALSTTGTAALKGGVSGIAAVFEGNFLSPAETLGNVAVGRFAAFKHDALQLADQIQRDFEARSAAFEKTATSLEKFNLRVIAIGNEATRTLSNGAQLQILTAAQQTILRRQAFEGAFGLSIPDNGLEKLRDTLAGIRSMTAQGDLKGSESSKLNELAINRFASGLGVSLPQSGLSKFNDIDAALKAAGNTLSGADSARIRMTALQSLAAELPDPNRRAAALEFGTSSAFSAQLDKPREMTEKQILEQLKEQTRIQEEQLKAYQTTGQIVAIP